jgi:hypothetical protein
MQVFCSVSQGTAGVVYKEPRKTISFSTIAVEVNSCVRNAQTRRRLTQGSKQKIGPSQLTRNDMRHIMSMRQLTRNDIRHALFWCMDMCRLTSHCVPVTWVCKVLLTGSAWSGKLKETWLVSMYLISSKFATFLVRWWLCMLKIQCPLIYWMHADLLFWWRQPLKTYFIENAQSYDKCSVV